VGPHGLALLLLALIGTLWPFVALWRHESRSTAHASLSSVGWVMASGLQAECLFGDIRSSRACLAIAFLGRCRLTGLMAVLVASRPEIHKHLQLAGRCNRIVNCLAAVIFHGPRAGRTGDSAGVPLSWQKATIFTRLRKHALFHARAALAASRERLGCRLRPARGARAAWPGREASAACRPAGRSAAANGMQRLPEIGAAVNGEPGQAPAPRAWVTTEARVPSRPHCPEGMSAHETSAADRAAVSRSGPGCACLSLFQGRAETSPTRLQEDNRCYPALESRLRGLGRAGVVRPTAGQQGPIWHQTHEGSRASFDGRASQPWQLGSNNVSRVGNKVPMTPCSDQSPRLIGSAVARARPGGRQTFTEP